MSPLKSRSVNLLAELSQELADMQTLIRAYGHKDRSNRARIANLETELCVSIYEKLRWQAQAKRTQTPVIETHTLPRAFPPGA